MKDIKPGDMIRETIGSPQEYQVQSIDPTGIVRAITAMGNERIFFIDDIEKVERSGYRKPGS